MAGDDDFPINLILDPSKAIAGADAFDQKVKQLVQGQVALGNAVTFVTDKEAEAFKAVRRSIESTIDVQNSLLRGNKDVAEAAEALDGIARRGIATTESQRATILSLVQVRTEQAEQLRAIQAAEERESSLLRAIHGPMETYIADVRALNSLLDQGKISAQQYDAQLERIEGEKAAQSAGLGAPGGGGFLSKLGVGEETAGALGGAAAGLGVVGGAIGAVQAGKSIIEEADAYTELQNRVRQFTSSEQELNDVTEQLFEISDKNRVSIDATGETYSKLANALQEAGFSSTTTLHTLDLLEEAIKTSGATTGQSSRTLLEFGEALSTGELKGRQFQSILRNTPTLLTELAHGLGVTTQQFDEMSKEGKLTTDVIVKALSGASDEIKERFSKTVPTIGEEFTILKNDIEQSIGSVAQGLGPLFAKIEPVAKTAIQGLAPFIADVVKISAAFFELSPEFELVIGAFKLLGPVASALDKVLGPIADVLEKIAGLVGDVFGAIGDAAGEVGHLLGETFDEADNSLVASTDSAKKFADELASLGISAASTSDDVGGMTEAEQTLIDALVSGNTHGDTFNSFLQVVADSHKVAGDAAKQHAAELDKLRDTIDAGGKAQKDFAAYGADVAQLLQAQRITTDQAGAALERYEQENEKALDPIGALSGKISDHIAALQDERGENSAGALAEKYINDLRTQGVLLTDDQIQSINALSVAEADAIKQHEKHAKAIAAGAKETKSFAAELFPLAKAEKELADVTKYLDELVKQHKITLEVAAEAYERYRQQHLEILDPIAAASQTIDQERDAINATTLSIRQQRDVAALTGDVRTKAVADAIAANSNELKAEQKVNEEILKGTLALADRAKAVARLVEEYKTLDLARALAEENAAASAGSIGIGGQRELTLSEQVTAAINSRDQNTSVSAIGTPPAAHLQDVAKEYADYEKKAAAAGDIAANLDEEWRKLATNVGSTGKILAEGLGSTFDLLNKSILTAVETGKLSLTDLRDSFIKIVDEMALKILESKIIQYIASLGTGGVGGAVAAAGGGGTSFSDLLHLPGYASGVELDVGGRPGVDQNIFSARVSRGEHISITPAGQPANSNGRGAAAPNIHIVNVVDPKSVLDILKGPDGRDIIFNHVRLNPTAFRGLISK